MARITTSLSSVAFIFVLAAAATAVSQEPEDYTISTIAGTGVAGYNGDDRPAIGARTNAARDVFVGPEGSVYFSDESNSRVRRIRPDGQIETIAGTGIEGYTGDGGPAKSAQISKARGVTVLVDGTLIFADSWNNVIRQVDPLGVISTICGTGVEGFNGDGQPALQTQLSRPNDVVMGPDGLLYISDGRNHRVRRIRADGRVEGVAGNGTEGFGGDDGPAVAATLDSPSGIAFGPEDELYIADEDNHRVRVVEGGTIRTVVGTGEGALGANHVVPLEARLHAPRDLAVGPDGTIYIADTENHRIARVRPGDNFEVLAGNGTAAYAGDGGPAPSGRVNSPKGIAVGPDGSVYVGDSGNSVIRAIRPPLVQTPKFHRGDADLTGILAINDPVVILNFLFSASTALPCPDAADADDSGLINITDPIYVLRFLFLGDTEPPSPHPACGVDPTDDELGCEPIDACGSAP